ncbi:unnamed protein product [Coregonus sp. 'balchen']|nr:unnamed protein product [Coregonus sp. 'balchen']
MEKQLGPYKTIVAACREDKAPRNAEETPAPFVGSPSALSDPQLNQKMRQAAEHHGRTLYVPSGALWGGQDILRLNDSGSLKALFIRMSKHPSCFRLTGDVLSDWTEDEGRRVLFSGSVAELCPVAPNNVEVTGANGFTVHTVRRNPAKLGAVTGSATYNSFWSSLLVCKGHGGRVKGLTLPRYLQSRRSLRRSVRFRWMILARRLCWQNWNRRGEVEERNSGWKIT